MWISSKPKRLHPTFPTPGLEQSFIVKQRVKISYCAVIARFHQERLLAASLTHPNLVAAFDAGGVAGLPYFVMEFVEGVGLDALVRQQGPLPVAEACEVVRQAALGLRPSESARPRTGPAGE
jgi:serine/threonine protein kinase